MCEKNSVYLVLPPLDLDDLPPFDCGNLPPLDWGNFNEEPSFAENTDLFGNPLVPIKLCECKECNRADDKPFSFSDCAIQGVSLHKEGCVCMTEEFREAQHFTRTMLFEHSIQQINTDFSDFVNSLEIQGGRLVTNENARKRQKK